MPRKGMRTVFFSSSRASSPARSPYGSPLRGSSPAPRHTFSASITEENLDIAESIVRKWSIEEGSSYCKIESLFGDDRKEAKDFLRSVKDLQAAMQFFLSEGSSSGHLVRAQSLMQMAMKRLEKEFYRILSTNRNYLDPESVSSRSSRASRRSSSSDFDNDASEDELGDSVSEGERVSDLVMADLKLIADAMIASGYTKECLKIYKLIRKSIVDESLYYLGIEKLNLSQFQKFDWEAIELKIKTWLNSVKVAVKTIFNGERILCDNVFSASPRIAESCFAEIARENARALFGFPELVSKFKKLSPEKMFRVLDLYDAVSELWPEIESIFSYESMSAVRSQAVNSLVKLGEAVRGMLLDFETAIQKDVSKSPVPSGGVHPLTRYVMNYIVFLSDYSGILADIVADWPLSNQSPLPESYYSSPNPNSYDSAITERLAWLILVLLCKLDGKAELYKDVSLSYLFLANNLNYVVSKVRTSNLTLLIGDDWVVKHERKVKQYAANYERMGWDKVISSVPELNRPATISPESARKCFRSFNSAFEEAYQKQASWIVADQKLRDEIKVSLARKLVPAYRSFYEKYGAMFRRGMGAEAIVRYAPDDLGNYLSDLFYGTGGGEYTSKSSISSSSPSPSSRSSEHRGR
ncbi:Exocyst complex component EXO70A1 like [Actinidia chinensis var. chinensis]|uniref:Exocyst subunit Exo70 family protein n=1 Tax=Actinidia chinensis var. chinensis TaxID=1590841 RepID=A0A2R6P7T3_ACTCC|nr:Exocyst complex component EXO70A1 like [Actinidia chinensis var. chinensis]